MSEQRWVFVMKVQDAPGTLTAIASVFSSRGVSLETILGNGLMVCDRNGGGIVLSFRATERKKETLLRIVRRLAKVIDVQDYPYTAPELRAVAIVRLSTLLVDLDALPAHAEIISEGEEGGDILLSGDTQRVDAALNLLCSQQILLDAMLSVVAV